MKKVSLLLFFFSLSIYSFAQLPYMEDFTGENGKGAVGPTPTIDVSGVDWAVDVSAASLTATTDWFQVQNEVMEARDTDGEVVWESPSIDITGITSIVNMSVDFSESGDHETDDYASAYYILDGGAEVLFSTNGNNVDDFTSATAEQALNISGNTFLKVVIKMSNNAGSEYLRFDNLSVAAAGPCTVPTDASNLAATTDNAQSVLSWTLPICYDDFLVVAKSGSSVTNTPSGDGTAYTADAAFGSGTDLGAGEFVVYKGTGMTETVTALTNGTQYFFTIFTRKGTSWSAGIEVDVTPSNEVCEAFDNGSTLPTGWSGAGIGQYSTGNFSPKSLKFDDTGDVLTSPQTTNATGFSFYIKGNSTSGSYSFLVEGFDGTTFTTIEDITAVTSNYVQKTYTGLPNYQGFRLTYANKASGNMAVDDICISADAISVTPTPLPVELISFNANPTNEGIQLTWETATELNNDYFIVQKSVNGKTFEDLGQVAGAGTTTEVQSYGFLDVTPANGTNYYRLKQVDFDGKFEYSNVISVETEKGLTAVDVYPNPSAGRYNVELSDNWTTQTTLEVFDMTGRLVYSKNVQNNVSELNLEHLSNGSYFLRLTNESDVFTTRIVKTK